LEILKLIGKYYLGSEVKQLTDVFNEYNESGIFSKSSIIKLLSKVGYSLSDEEI